MEQLRLEPIADFGRPRETASTDTNRHKPGESGHFRRRRVGLSIWKLLLGARALRLVTPSALLDFFLFFPFFSASALRFDVDLFRELG